MRTVPKMTDKNTLLAECKVCGHRRKIPYSNQRLGEIINPYPGGGDYGRCLMCKREGLLVIHVPEEEPIKPTGWSGIPR